MKIGIITFISTNDNYGQVLQAFALRQYLLTEGHEVLFIDYKPNLAKEVNKSGVISYIKDLIRNNIILKVREFQGRRFKESYPRDFSKFKLKYLPNTGKTYYNYEQVKNDSPDVDALICGSDQVWNTGITQDASIYYLNFGEENTIRIAYAPSFGRRHKDPIFIHFLEEQLRRFQAISVREKKGISLCELAGVKSAIQVVDPTLLLNKKQYIDLIIGQKTWNAQKKIFCYFLNIKKSEEVYWTKIRQFCKASDADLRLTISSGIFPATALFGDIPYYAPSPEEWIETIHQCDTFITNSFHGVAFAIILQKKFIYIPFSGKRDHLNDRIVSLLSLLNLEARIFDKNRGFQEQIDSPIDWSSVNGLLEKEIIISKEFLKNGLLTKHNK